MPVCRRGPARILVCGPTSLMHVLRGRLLAEPSFTVSVAADPISAVSNRRPDLLLLADIELLKPLIMESLDELSRRGVPLLLTGEELEFLDDIRMHPVVRAALPVELADSPLLIPVIHGLVAGQAYILPLPPDKRHQLLSEAEYLALALMALGLDNAALAEALERSQNAVYHLQSRMRRKLGAATTPQMVIDAVRHGVVGVLTPPIDQEAAR